jgi:hypothetical protein
VAIKHKDLEPATRIRVDLQSDLGRDLSYYIKAIILKERGEVTETYVTKRHNEYKQVLKRLIEAAQDEGASEVEDYDD